MTDTQKKLLIVDGNSILNRAYYGIRPLTAPDGTPTNAVYGFLNILEKYMGEYTPDHLCVAFDLKAPTFRHKMYDGYKAQRKPAPEDFLAQIPIIKEVLAAMDCKCLELEGYEADDIIGTVTRICDESNVRCAVLTGDKDDLQLASDNTVISLVVTRGGSTNTTLYDAEAVKEKYGVTPSEYIDVKALMGDPSDNIPGVKGVGEKTAFSLIKRYKTLDYIYDHLDEIEVTKSVRTKLANDKESAYMSRRLSEIVRDVPIEADIGSMTFDDPDNAELYRIFKRLGFNSRLKGLSPIGDKDEDKNKEQALPPVTADVKEVDEDEILKAAAGDAFYVFDPDADRLTLACEEGKALSAVMSADGLRAFFADENIKKRGFNLKRDMLELKRRGTEYNGAAFDVLIAAYISDPARPEYDIASLCAARLGRVLDIKADDGQISMDDGGDNSDGVIACAILLLCRSFETELKENGQEKLYYEIELPLIKVLADMQTVGMYVDKAELNAFGKKLKARIAELTAEIHGYAGCEFNINSPKQLGEVLFETLGLPHGKKTKNGYSTNIDVLNKLRGVHPIIEDVIEYRTVTKLNSTYVDSMLGVINRKTGRIHSSFNQTVTATGRISSTEPNLQNIPVRTELGREIRKMFAAEGDRILIDADYSQIELRVLAAISDDENMKAAFLSGEDIHRTTAAQVFGVPPEDVTPAMRSRAKAVNFGIVYGIGAFSLAQDIKVSRAEAESYINGYLSHYKGVDRYMQNAVSEARKNGYVTTMYGRRRYLPELKAKNKNVQAFGERVARNAPIQGTAADIIKIAMVNVYDRIKAEGLRSRLILQVHDELVVETVPEECERIKEILRGEMEGAADIGVPLIVDLNSGKRWYDAK